MILNEKHLTQPKPIQPVGLACTGAMSFLAAGATIGSVASPLAAAAAGALPPVYSLSMLAGGLLAFFLSGMDPSAGAALCALVMTVFGRCLLGERIRPRASAWIVGGSIIVSSLLFFLLGFQPLTDLVQYLFLGSFAAICTYFCADLAALRRRGEPLRIDSGKGISFALVYLLLTAVLAPVSVSFLHPGLLFAAFAVLTASERYRLQGGLLCGALTTAGILLCDVPIGQRAVFLALGGLAAGYFADLGKGAMLGIFLIINAAAQLLLGAEPSGYVYLGNLALGGLVYLLVPAQRFLDSFLPEHSVGTDSTALAAVRMDFLAQSLADVRKNAEQVAKMLERSQHTQSAAAEVCESVCGTCAHRLNCWDDHYTDMNEKFLRLAERPKVSVDELFEQIPDCRRRESLSAAFTRCAKQRAQGRIRAARLFETRELLFSQMQFTEEILRTATDRLQLRFCAEQTRLAMQVIEAGNYPFHTALAYYTPSHRLNIELYVDQGCRIDAEAVCESLSEATGRQLFYTDEDVAGHEKRLCIWETAPFGLTCCGVQSAAQENQPCGDNYEQFTDGQGNTYLILSDGMGTGRQAALDSRIVLSNFKRLILTGVEWRTALSMVNSIMLTKSGEERFATLDCLRLDGETGEATMVKQGASPTLIWKDGKLVCYQSPSCPVGIAPRTEPFVKTISLNHGDVIVLLSDGVDPALYPALRQVLSAGCTLEDAAQQLCDMARRVGSSAPDDITILLSYVERNKKM